MRNILDVSLKNLKWIKIRKKRISNTFLLLSFVVTVGVFWGLRQPGLTLAGDATCGIQEHTHDDTCGTKICICDLSEEPHVHDDCCYEVAWIEEREEYQLICEETDEAHIHDDNCYDVVVTRYTENGRIAEEEETRVLICSLSEEAHIHGEDCYEWDLTCGLEEHVHSLACYSDASADVETVLDWEEMFEDYPYTGDLREDLVGVALTQVGYSESTLNFEVDKDGIRHGYTRYGAWYGTPYKDWSAMFVSFCLNYAEADMDETPGNTGAKSMIKLWKKLEKYAPADAYTPVSGDLVFFDDNTVGIVAETQTSTIYVIRGDVDDEVCTDLFALTDESIIGWGVTVGTAPESEKRSDSEFKYEEYMLDISNGPAFYIFENGEARSYTESFSFRMPRSTIDLLSYMEANGGSYFFTLLNMNNQEPEKDDDGNYIVEANEGYKLTLTFNSPNGFPPGVYEYQVPNGLLVDGGEGTFILNDGTEVGSWTVTDTGLITLVFNEHMNSRTDIAISATMGLHFPKQEEPIDFDGLIKVVVKPPPEQKDPTVLQKWGSPSESDAGKINWSVRIDGHADSQIPGSVLTDQVVLNAWDKPHQYTESDIAGGISFVVSDNNGNWHRWSVTDDDPRLVWDENGWSYKIPKTVICEHCGELELGNNGWVYYINYTSTPIPLDTPGTFDYENKVTVDNRTAWGWSNFVHSEIEAQIVKDGSFVSDAAGGSFLWEIRATIPGRKEDQRAEYSWFIMDEMKLLDDNGVAIGRVNNDADLALVTATYNGTTIVIPRIQDATDEDMFAWDNAWTATDDGISHTRTINLLCRCQCTPETCHWGVTSDYYWFEDDDGLMKQNGFCQCWTETKNMTFTFVYRTKDLSMIENYAALGYQVNNLANLYYKPDSDSSVRVSYDGATVTIPNLFEKKLTHDFDGYTANYKVTVNEAKLALTNGTPLYIHDVMTDTLAYISGSLVITAEDANGNVTTLKQDQDFTVTYDGTGNQTDKNGKKVHVLDIVVLHPQPVMYTLDYDATLIIPDNVTESVKYSNSATITLWGQSFTENTVEKVYADINIAAKSYKVEMVKTSAETGEPLGGATFGLYNEQGGLISSATTDADGRLSFQTNIVQGIILREHIPYYMQELSAPPGYQLDHTKHWFCFCGKTGDSCDVCDVTLAGKENAVRIPFEQIGRIYVTNEFMNYNLPTTGGFGIYPLILVSVTFIVIPLVYYGFMERRKRERRRTRRYSRTSANMRRR